MTTPTARARAALARLFALVPDDADTGHPSTNGVHVHPGDAINAVTVTVIVDGESTPRTTHHRDALRAARSVLVHAGWTVDANTTAHVHARWT